MMWEAPQYVMGGLLVWIVVAGLVFNGRAFLVNGSQECCEAMIIGIVLYWGGFWS